MTLLPFFVNERRERLVAIGRRRDKIIYNAAGVFNSSVICRAHIENEALRALFLELVDCLFELVQCILVECGYLYISDRADKLVAYGLIRITEDDVDGFVDIVAPVGEADGGQLYTAESARHFTAVFGSYRVAAYSNYLIALLKPLGLRRGVGIDFRYEQITALGVCFNLNADTRAASLKLRGIELVGVRVHIAAVLVAESVDIAVFEVRVEQSLVYIAVVLRADDLVDLLDRIIHLRALGKVGYQLVVHTL